MPGRSLRIPAFSPLAAHKPAGYRGGMRSANPGLIVVPATADRFDDLATMLAPKSPGVVACWCLTYRLDSATNRALTADERREMARSLSSEPMAPGVLAYDGDLVVGWAAVAPRENVRGIHHNSKIPEPDDLPVFSLWCLKVRAGHRGQGIAAALIDGAVRFAFAHGAPAVESYPIDNHGVRVDTTSAFVGTRALFEAAGFEKVADTASTSAKIPRILMRRRADAPVEATPAESGDGKPGGNSRTR
jgi:GNAT superfamily N-acetyltransferase